MSFPPYEPAGTRCTGSAQPGVAAFMSWAVQDYGRGASNLGIYNCRTVRGSTTRSLHGEGRAGDVGFPGVANPAGTELLELLLPHVGELGIQYVIWNRRAYSAKAPSGQAYRGVSPHTDHLHIEFTWDAARTLTRDRVRAVLAQVEAPATLPSLPDEEDEMYMRNTETGDIYAVSATHYQPLNEAQWEDRVKEGAGPKLVQLPPAIVFHIAKSRVRVD